MPGAYVADPGRRSGEEVVAGGSERDAPASGAANGAADPARSRLTLVAAAHILARGQPYTEIAGAQR